MIKVSLGEFIVDPIKYLQLGVELVITHPGLEDRTILLPQSKISKPLSTKWFKWRFKWK